MIERTHVVTIYRPAISSGTRGEDVEGWTEVADGVECNIQGKRGAVRQAPDGQRVSSTRTGFFPAGTDVQEGDGIAVTSGPGPPQLRAGFVSDPGSGFDIETDLERIDVSFT